MYDQVLNFEEWAKLAGRQEPDEAVKPANPVDIPTASKKTMSASSEDLEFRRKKHAQASDAGYMQEFIDDIVSGDGLYYVSTGFNKLDNLLGRGLCEGLYVIGAISSLGKTTFMMQMANQIAKAGNDVSIFSMETKKKRLIACNISRLTLIDAIKNGGNEKDAKTAIDILDRAAYSNYSQQEMDRIQRAMSAYMEYAGNIHTYEGSSNTDARQIIESVQEHIDLTGKKPVVIIDYLQLLAPGDMHATDKQNIDKTVEDLSCFARDCSLPVVVISSFNRSNYNGPVTMEAFKESGNIEYSSDVLLGLQLKGVGSKDFDVNIQKAKNPREIELVVSKNRINNVGCKDTMKYYPKFGYFKEV